MPELRLENSIVDDRYLVEACLGRGSYAEIFLAYDRARGNEPVIIKALNTGLQGTPDAELEQTLIENFQNEAIALDKVRHPHIIRRLGHGTAADLTGAPFHYLLLEYMPGGDLLSLCRKRPFDLETALFYFQQVAEALAYAHSQKVIHRDIKPNNLLLSAGNEIVKIADFGVAKMALDDAVEITRVGTNVYAPPEHHPDSPTDRLNEKLTPSADLYSLAKTIYTAMTGRAPRQFARQPITSLPAELANKPWTDSFLSMLRRATAPRAAERYQSVQEFWEDFARLADYIGAENVEDAEATVVRSRLSATSNIERAAARPNFHSLSDLPAQGGGPQKARIIVPLPERRSEVSNLKPQMVGTVATPLTSDAPPPVSNLASVESSVVERGRRDQTAFRTKKVSEDIERTFFDDLRDLIGSEWLRRAFIILLVAALIGVSASIYYHFAGQSIEMPAIFGGYKEGTIANALNVNLRSEPGGMKLVMLPRGTRVRVLESRGGWARVRVTEWVGNAPDNAPDEGWVDNDYIQLD